MRARPPLLLIALFVVFSPVLGAMTDVFDSTSNIVVNSTSTLSTSTGAPYDIWIYSIIVTAIIILVSFLQFPKGEEGLVSVMAWFTSGYAFFSAFNVDRITGAGFLQAADYTFVFMEKHTIYHFDLLAWTCLAPLFICSIINTIRIWMNMRAMKQIATVDQDDAPPEASL